MEYYASNKTDDCKCKTPCEETRYGVSQSFALFPSDFVLEVLKDDLNVSGEYIRYVDNEQLNERNDNTASTTSWTTTSTTILKNRPQPKLLTEVTGAVGLGVRKS